MSSLRRWLRDGRWLWAFGSGFFLWHFGHLLHHPSVLDTLSTAVFSVLGPISASGAVLAVGVALGRQWGTASLRYIGRWVAIGAATAALLGILTVIYFRLNGVVLPEQAHFVSNVTTGGTVAGSLVGVYDARAARVSNRLRHERRRVSLLNQRLHVLNRVLRHDLRNDVNVVHGYASLLADFPDPVVSERGEIIREKSEALISLSERARHLQQLLEGEQIDTETDLGTVVSRRLEAFKREYPAAKVNVDVPDRAPVGPVPLLGVVVELLAENAVIHNDRDEPLVSVRVRTDDDHVILRVADNGPGIPETERAVFESGTETPLRHSEGLGLWVVEWAVNEAGGDLDFRNREVGTVVSVTLPRTDSEIRDDAGSVLDVIADSDHLDASLQPFRGGPE
ncbi:histidine kinase [Halogeometricum borinquense]|uniref:histidine kinase n=1 Tax=Halogeometricum borinquense TaxID=60847 RepID=A0A482TLL0_9EURY|nr:ATP-binding protein [Halogeometricum borinquense]RYJ12889.1 histidine kinase [Halogeometricum borinquense]